MSGNIDLIFSGSFYRASLPYQSCSSNTFLLEGPHRVLFATSRVAAYIGVEANSATLSLNYRQRNEVSECDQESERLDRQDHRCSKT
jgi:hypothetical protein